ncbi:MAG: sce7726 family protein [Hungatella sp.]|nr:sce7726 family protein [Hungatella sp.]
MNASTNNLIINRLFTQNVFYNLLNEHSDSTYYTVVKRYINDVEDKNNGELICEIYEFMAKAYRNEYFYQNTLLNKLLLGRHSINTTTALTQIPIGKSKADFILINGKAVVYEIKTELDSLDRLDTQLKDYFTAFNHVCVVTSESHYEKVKRALGDTPVGIYVLTEKNKISSKLKKEPLECNAYLSHIAIFKVLHKREYEEILMRYFQKLPDTSQVFYYNECMKLFLEIPILDAYAMALKELKKRNNIVKDHFEKVPYELKSLVYFSKSSVKEFKQLYEFLNKKFGG